MQFASPITKDLNMTTTTHSRALALPRHSAPLLGSILSLAALWRSRRALAALDPARLDDLGISASDAAREAARAPWDVPSHWLK